MTGGVRDAADTGREPGQQWEAAGVGVISPIRDFIARRFPDETVRDDDDIFELGLASSLFAMELVRYVERTFDFEVPDDQMVLENFCSVEAMSQLVERCAVAPATS
ncbi:phosphopantetheine-binding protein [Streptomyces sp. Je 1-332]|uniref:acyl carrier protein n=1 Tax=Streptomyces sp. Je 1-332 TaxID=3231270 RepID=UPI00345A6D5E